MCVYRENYRHAKETPSIYKQFFFLNTEKYINFSYDRLITANAFISTVSITSPCLYQVFANGEFLGESFGGFDINEYTWDVPNTDDIILAVKGFCQGSGAGGSSSPSS